MEFLEKSVLGNQVQSWLVAVALFVGIRGALAVAKRVLVRKIAPIAEQTAVLWDDVLVLFLRHTHPFFFYALALLGAVIVLDIPEKAHRWVHGVTFTLTLVQAGIWGTALIRFWVEKDRALKSPDGAREQTVRAIAFLGTLLLYVLLFLLALDGFGVNITALVAGLGVGGIAIALAVQNILGDLFASLTIVLDKPFVYGDFIIVGDFKGTIEHVGLKTTRVRSLSGEQLIFPNADLLQSRIRNYKRMQERRICFQVGVVYETPIEKLRDLAAALRKIVESHPRVRFERSHMMQLGASSIDFEVVYWILVAEYQIYMDTHQKILLQILELFQQREMSFAYPTQTLYQHNAD